MDWGEGVVRMGGDRRKGEWREVERRGSEGIWEKGGEGFGEKG